MKTSRIPQDQSLLQQQPQVFEPSLYAKKGFPEEEVLKIKEVFDTFDVDKTGLLSLQDLKMQITTLGMEDEARAIYDVLTDLDISEDQEVDFGEFLHLFGFTADLKDDNTVIDIFNQFDSDKDGYLTLEDFQRICNQCDERYTPTELREMVYHADRDKDQKISLQEFKKVVQRNYRAV